MAFPATVFAATGLIDNCNMILEQGAGRWHINIELKQPKKKKNELVAFLACSRSSSGTILDGLEVMASAIKALKQNKMHIRGNFTYHRISERWLPLLLLVISVSKVSMTE